MAKDIAINETVRDKLSYHDDGLRLILI